MKNLGNNKGAAAVEFALVLIPLLIIVFGIIEFGLLMYNQQIITNASREGARAGIVAPTPRLLADSGGVCGTITYPPESIKCVVDNYAKAYMITFGATNDPVTVVTGYASNALFGQNLQVTVSYNYGFLVFTKFVPIVGPTITLSASTVMKYE